MTWLLLMLGIWIWWLVGYRNRKQLRQIAKELPTKIPAWPLIGQAYLYIGTDEDRMTAFQKFARDAIQQGGVTAVWQASQLYLFVVDPEIGELLLKTCLEKDENTVRFTRAIFGNGSIFAPVNRWRPCRKILAPAFRPRNLKSFVEIFTKQSATLVELLRPMVGAGDFSIWKYVTKYSLDAVSETNLGVNMNAQHQDYHPYLEASDKATSYVAARMCQPWLYSDFVYRLLPSYWKCRKYTKYMDNFVDQIVKEKRISMNTNGPNKTENINGIKSKPSSFLEMIIESSGGDKGYNDIELREETKVIMIAGTDTSAVGTSFALVLLSRYSDIQDAVYKELYEVFGNSNRMIVPEDLPKLKYLEAVIKETLRLYPPGPIIAREVHNDVKLPTGTTLVKGVKIIMNIWGMHRNHRYWGEDADCFRPERFLEGPLKHPVQFIPFSHGMRNCIGYQYAMMSMKSVLACLLRSYRVLPPAGLNPARYHDPLRVKYDIMLRNVDGYIVRLENRT